MTLFRKCLIKMCCVQRSTGVVVNIVAVERDNGLSVFIHGISKILLQGCQLSCISMSLPLPHLS